MPMGKVPAVCLATTAHSPRFQLSKVISIKAPPMLDAVDGTRRRSEASGYRGGRLLASGRLHALIQARTSCIQVPLPPPGPTAGVTGLNFAISTSSSESRRGTEDARLDAIEDVIDATR